MSFILLGIAIVSLMGIVSIISMKTDEREFRMHLYTVPPAMRWLWRDLEKRGWSAGLIEEIVNDDWWRRTYEDCM